jgi:hypothetical protein
MGALVSVMMSCSTSGTKEYTAHAGDPCQNCDQCCTAGSCCVCDSCSDFAFDPVAKQLLMCDRGTLKWRVTTECPGGGYARCVNDHAQRTSCIGADGGQVI